MEPELDLSDHEFEKSENHLNGLSILFLIKGIIHFLGAAFFSLYVLMGGMFSKFVEMPKSSEFPFDVGEVLMFIGGIGITVFVAYGILTLLAAKYTKEKRRYNYILIIGILNAFSGLVGIALGIFTVLELSKPKTKAFFRSSKENKS